MKLDQNQVEYLKGTIREQAVAIAEGQGATFSRVARREAAVLLLNLNGLKWDPKKLDTK